MSKLLSIGKILNFHGIKGEVKIGFTRGRENAFKSLKQLFVEIDGNMHSLSIDSVRFHKQHALVHFKEINSINDVMIYKGKNLYAERSLIMQNLSDDEYLITDLIGLEVYSSDDEKIGIISDVGNNNAGELLQIQNSQGKSFLVPFVKDIVPVVDLNKKLVVINNIKGLIE